MRLGEIKNKLSKVLDENRHLHIESETIFGGQAYRINNLLELLEVINFLSKQPWNDADYKQIEEIVSRFKAATGTAIVNADEFNRLNSYLSSLNSKIPLFYSFLESFVEKQDEKAINIKLPSGVDSLESLNALNKRLENILKFFNIDGPFEFRGFDKGTDWYVLVAAGILSHQYLISCIKVAQEYLKAKTEYFKSKEAQISYEVALVNQEKEGLNFDQYQEKWLEKLMEGKIKEVIDSIKETNGHTKEELQVKLVRATTQLVKELGEGTEFHLSLNPPKYAKEKNGQLVIDYKKIEELKPKSKTIQQLPSPKDKTEDKKPEKKDQQEGGAKDTNT